MEVSLEVSPEVSPEVSLEGIPEILPEDTNYNILCLGGGGIYGISILGSLHFLEMYKILIHNSIESFIGTSIGGIICSLLCIGYTSIQIFEWFNKEFNNFENFINFKLISNPLNISDDGILKLDKIINVLSTFIIDKLGNIPTLHELYDNTKKELIVTTIKNTEIIYLSHITYPNMLLTDALKLTCALPFIFEKCKVNNDTFIDGGLLNNFPINYNFQNKYKKILGIYLTNKYNDNNIIEYIYSILTLASNRLVEMNIESSIKKFDNRFIVSISPLNLISLNFVLSPSQKYHIFCHGFDETKKLLKTEL